MAGTNQGIIDPPIDSLLEKVDSKYQLVIFASKRARQINDYYSDLHEGNLFDNVGPARRLDRRGQAPHDRAARDPRGQAAPSPRRVIRSTPTPPTRDAVRRGYRRCRSFAAYWSRPSPVSVEHREPR